MYKCSLCLSDAAEAGALTDRLPELAMRRFAGEDWYAVSHPDANKHHAASAVAAALDIGREGIYAFGDDLVDLEMVAGAGHGVAPANALPIVRAAARSVCGPNSADGVARWIEERLLGDEDSRGRYA